MQTIAPGVHQVSFGVNSFIVDGDQGVTLIDTGWPRRHGRIIDGLRQIGRGTEDVTAIMVSHAHTDHLGGAAALVRETGAGVFVGEADTPAARGDQPLPIPPVFERFGLLKPFHRLIPKPEPIDVGVMALPSDITVIATPGHTPGHVSFLLHRARGIMFVGDAAVRCRRGHIKRGAMNRSTPTLDASIGVLAGHDFAAACFGHSAPMMFGASGMFRRFADAIVS